MAFSRLSFGQLATNPKYSRKSSDTVPEKSEDNPDTRMAASSRGAKKGDGPRLFVIQPTTVLTQIRHTQK